MFHPVGSQPPNVYWRRRLIVFGSAIIVIVLLVVTLSAVTSGGSGASSRPNSSSPVADGHASLPTSHAPTRTSTPTSASPSGTTSSSGAASGASNPATVATCRPADLAVAAVVGQSTYHVGARPTVELQVTNVGSAPCAQDLADKQVLLKVYNGVSRVWGSHDCETQPGTNERTLAVGAPVRVSVSWSGETSQPGCTGTRQQVGAGTYTLYATLSGKTGKATRFTIS